MASYRGGYEIILKEVESALKNCKRGVIKGKEAIIVVDVLVTEKGKVAKVDVIDQTTDLCVSDIITAIQDAKQWIQGRIGNKPVNSFLQMKFNLNNEVDQQSKSINYMK